MQMAKRPQSWAVTWPIFLPTKTYLTSCLSGFFFFFFFFFFSFQLGSHSLREYPVICVTQAFDWWQYLGATSTRLFLSPSSIEPQDDFAPWGDGVTTMAQFQVRPTLCTFPPFLTKFVFSSLLNSCKFICAACTFLATRVSCQARKTAMRAAELANANFANDQYVYWSYFLGNYNACCNSDAIWKFNYLFPTLTNAGVDIMLQMSAAPTRCVMVLSF
jgi:hypothetical protein